MTLKELAEALGAELRGGGSEEVLGVTGLGSVPSGFVSYAEDARRLAQAEGTPALAVITHQGLSSQSKPLLLTDNPRLTFARALALLHPAPSPMEAGVHPTAQLGREVSLGEGVAIGPFVVIGDGVEIGARAQVYALVWIGAGAVVGSDSLLYPNVTLYPQVHLGSRVTVHAGSVIGSPGFGYVWDGQQHVWIPHVGTVIVEDDVEIGANVCIDRGTTGATFIGKGTKIDNLVQVAHNVVIGRNCLIAGQVGLSGSVTLEDGVVLAGQAGVADHVTMREGAIGAAGADIIREIPAGQVVIGRPARPIKQQMRIDAAAAQLPELVQEVRRLRKRVAELEKRAGGE